MNRPRLRVILALLALVVAACTGGAQETSTSRQGDQAPTTTSGPPATSRPGPDVSEPTTDRELSLVGCDDPPEEVAIVCEVYDLIKTQYVDEVDDQTLANAAAEGLSALDGAGTDDLLVCAAPTGIFDTTCDTALVEADSSAEAAEAMVNGFAAFALDPNSGYLDADALELLREEQQGEIEGIGALVSPEDETIPGDNKQCGVISETCLILVVSTIEGSPAEKVGLERDDVIVGVNGESILGWSVDEVTSSVRGPAGTEVTLTIEREGEELDITITRAAVIIPIVEQGIFDDIGYVRLRSFTGTAGQQFESAVVDVLSEGVSELVIDLRDNPGGFLDTAIEVTSLFLAAGDVVVTEGPDAVTNYPVNGSVIVPESVDVVFAVNKGSASASEVVSAVLQETGRAIVVGENTFGKNTVQQRFTLSNGGAMRLTIARWLTPDGLDFGGVGVTPDVTLDGDALSDMTAEELVTEIAGL